MKSICRWVLAALPAIWFASAQAASATGVLASGEHEVGGVRVDLLEVKRDSPTVVTVRWRYTNETAQPKQLTNDRTGWIDPYRLSVNSYLLDDAKQLKFPVSRDSDRRPVASRNGEPNMYITLRPKGTIEAWAKYIVPESTSRVTVSLEGLSPFGGVVIAQ